MSDPMEDLVEVVARAIFEDRTNRYSSGVVLPWNAQGSSYHEGCYHDARAALSAINASGAWKVVDSASVTLPLADYQVLLASAQCDEMMTECEVCKAWLYRDERAACTVDDFTACWKAATHRDNEPCVAYRQHALEAAISAVEG